MGYETRLTERERGIWRAALTLANNICVRESDRMNADDGPSEAIHATADCAVQIRGWIDADDKQLAAMLDEAGVPGDGPDPLCEALNGGDGSYRP